MNQEQVIDWANEGGLPRRLSKVLADVLLHVANRAAAAEREACAKVLDARVAMLDKEAVKQMRGGDVLGIGNEMAASATSCAAAAYDIRARGQEAA